MSKRKERWVITAKKADFNTIAERFAISPVTARLMRNRDLITMDDMEQYLYGTMDSLPSPSLLKDAVKAAKLIEEKIQDEKKIRIISDYDVDGVCSNYILYQGLRRLGADVDYHIPDRVADGYGINEDLIGRAYDDGIDTIITCDNGIAAKEQVAYGKSLGMTIIVTDHHDIPYEEDDAGEKHYILPEADAVVNPKQPDCPYPFKNICGAVVAFKFIAVLYEQMGIPSGEMKSFTEIAALATVCDVMPLMGENRVLVKQGLYDMARTTIKGLRALLMVNNLGGRKISAYHLGFIIGPCINASGRLSLAKEALELLLCDNEAKCHAMAEHLKELNEQRKEMTRLGVDSAVAVISGEEMEEDRVLVIYLPDCHESIAGIIAGRIKEIYHKPTFVLTRSAEGVKGSGRSIEGYHMHEEMTKIADLFDKYGGHPMAAGLSMQEDRVDEFRERINAGCMLTEQDLMPKIRIDVAMPVSYLSEDFIKELSLLEPFGSGNEKPLFAQKDLTVERVMIRGQSGRCVAFSLRADDGSHVEAVWFGEAQNLMDEIREQYGQSVLDQMKRGIRTGARAAVTYYPQINEWNGTKTIQIIIQNIMWS